MISLDKKYTTRDGREVRIYAVDGGGAYGVHGAIKGADGIWWHHCWMGSGLFGTIANPVDCTTADLIEVKPKITRTYWLIHRKDGKYLNAWTAEPPDHSDDAIAITGPHQVEFQEGDGL